MVRMVTEQVSFVLGPLLGCGVKTMGRMGFGVR
jgi:hypothetical protein